MGLVWLKAVGQAAVVDLPVHRLLVVAPVVVRTVKWLIAALVCLLTAAVADLEEDSRVERRSTRRQSTGPSRDATLVEEHGTGDSQPLREEYFEVGRGQVDGDQVSGGTHPVVAVAVEVFEDCYVEKEHAPDLVVASGRIGRIHPHSHCHRRGSAKLPTQTAQGSTVPALFLDLAQRPRGTDLISLVVGRACGLARRARGVECDFGYGGWAADEQTVRCSSPVWNRHSRRSMVGSWGRGWALLVKRGSVGRGNEGDGVRLQARMAFS